MEDLGSIWMPPWVLGDDCGDLAPKLVRLLLELKDGLSNGDVREHAASIGAAFVVLAESSDITTYRYHCRP